VTGEPAPRSFAIGGRAPARVVEPRDEVELAAALRGCDEAGESLVLFAGGTLQGIGSRPRRYDVAVDLARLSGIIAYEPRDLTVAAWAGTTLDALARRLARHGQFLPIDAPLPKRGTVGGALAAGWLGPRRARYLRPRDLVIGSTVALADGTLAKAGGMVVKNVTGYDMSKLYVGSLGTLAAIARVNFRTLPLPEVQRIALAPLPEGTRPRAAAHVRALEVEPSAALFIRGFPEAGGDDGLDGRAFLLFEGSAAVVDRATRDLRSAIGTAGVPTTTIVDRGAGAALQRAVDAYVASRSGGPSVTYRSLGLPSDVEGRAAVACDIASLHELRCETICDMRSGDLIARVSGNGVALDEAGVPFDDALHDALPNATILASPERMSGMLSAWGRPPDSIETMRRLKERFDPRGTLAPGRFVGGL
jgi:glycolate oxidase FAD binding subunit